MSLFLEKVLMYNLIHRLLIYFFVLNKERLRYGWAQGVARLNSKLYVDGSDPSNAPVVFVSKQLSLLGTGWLSGTGSGVTSQSI